MPAHITHLIFGEEALRKALDDAAEDILNQYGNIFRFGCQGPDFFYHNQRTKPSGLVYGSLLHHEQYGRFTVNMIRRLAEQEKLNSEDYLQAVSFILGFTTHAILDRKAHPFIAYFSGWVEKGNKKTDKYFKCHPFFERILDMKILKLKRGTRITDFDTGDIMYCGSYMPDIIASTFTKALNITFPRVKKPDDLKRFNNAYRDTLFLFEITNPVKPIFYEMALIRDITEKFKKRRIALFYTENLPEDIDYLNTRHSQWTHPCDNKDIRSSSFPEIYESAVGESASILIGLWRLLKKLLNGEVIKEKELAGLEKAIGNTDLESDRPDLTRCIPQFSNPLPLYEIMYNIYKNAEMHYNSVSYTDDN
ncbi:MAG: hypothetical protein DRP57_10220 [Spirochaetes bacterium]|nr:MAG: hypothetical protein DRP57_10220 [Spirochaetota bacterium]